MREGQVHILLVGYCTADLWFMASSFIRRVHVGRLVSPGAHADESHSRKRPGAAKAVKFAGDFHYVRILVKMAAELGSYLPVLTS